MHHILPALTHRVSFGVHTTREILGILVILLATVLGESGAICAADSLAELEAATLRERWRDVISKSDELVSTDQFTRVAVARYKAIALRQSGRESDALLLIDKTLKELSGTGKSGSRGKVDVHTAALDELHEWLLFEKGRLLLTQPKKRQQGMSMLEDLSHSSKSPIAPAVLHFLAVERSRADNIDGAALAFSLSREAFPDAVGEEQLIDLLAGDESSSDDTPQRNKVSTSTDETANRATNTRYAIQLGVFSAKANADALLIKVSSKKLPGSIEKKLVTGKQYYAALVGSFASLADAQRVRDSLETAHNASFTVITR